MVTKAEKIRAGVFVTVGMSLVLLAISIVAGIRLLESNETYYVEFTGSVGGLERGAAVTYKGVPVGQIQEIRFSPGDVEKIRVTLALQPDTPVKTDTRATTRVKGIAGTTVLELSGGTNDSEPLAPRQTIEADRAFLEALTYDVPQLLENLQALLSDFRGLADETNRAKISSILTSADEFFGPGTNQLLTAAEDLQAVSRDLRSATPKIEEILTDLQETVRVTGESLRDGAVSFKSTALRAEKVLADADLDALTADLKSVTGNLRDWTDRENPDSLIGEVESTVDDTQALIGDLRSLIETNGDAVSQALFNLNESTLVLQDFLKIVRSNPGVLLTPPRAPN